MDIAINYWSVLAAAVVNMIVGMIWYGPVFGKTWQKLMGFTEESMKNMPLSPMQAMIGGLVSALIMACVLSKFTIIYGAVGVAGAWGLAFMIWFGFYMTETAGSWLWEGRSFKLFLFNASERLVALFAMLLVLVLWN